MPGTGPRHANMLDLYKLEIFECVVEEGAFSAAAERLMMSQSGVSQHIRDLENTLGARLFERSRRGAEPTESGRMLYDYSHRILELVSAAEQAVADASEGNGSRSDSIDYVHIDATPGISIYVLSGWVQTYRERFPHRHVALETFITPMIVQNVMTHLADFGIIEGELGTKTPNGLRMHTLETIPQYVVIGRQHAFWNRTELNIAELDGQSFIMRQPAAQSRIWLNDMLAKSGVVPHISVEFDNIESIKRMVAAGSSLAILPEHAIRDEEAFGTLRALPIVDRPLNRSLKVVWDGLRTLSPGSRAFLTHLAQRYPALNVMLAGERSPGAH